jgi:hypothetical protein
MSKNFMCRLFALAVLCFVFYSAANAQQRGAASAPPGSFPTKESLLEKEATIASVNHLKNGNIKMILDGADEVTLTSNTMIYMLTKDNTEALAKKDKDTRRDEVYDNGKKFQGLITMRDIAVQRQQRGERLSGPQQAILASCLREEDERHQMFGPSVKLAKGMEIYLYSDKGGITYAVLVKYTDKAAQNKTKEGKTK